MSEVDWITGGISLTLSVSSDVWGGWSFHFLPKRKEINLRGSLPANKSILQLFKTSGSKICFIQSLIESISRWRK